MQILKQSTAITVKIGPFVDDTDGKTAETGLTISQADVRLSKNGAAFAQKNDATSCTHDENGMYGCPLNATDTGTLGRLQLVVFESGALPIWHVFMVAPANVYDSLFGSDKLQIHADEITAGLITAAAIADNAIAAAKIATGAITNAKFAAGAIDAAAIAADAIGSSEFAQAAADKVWSSATRALTDKAGFTISGTKTTLDDLNDLSAAQVNSEVDDALDTAIPTTPTADSINERLKRLEEDVTPTRAGYLDNLSAGAVALASVCTETRMAELDAANLPSDIDDILDDTGASGVILADGAISSGKIATDAITAAKIAADAIGASEFAQAAADKVWSSATRALTDKADFALSNAARDAIWDQISSLSSLSFETLIIRAFQLLNNKMNVTDSSGAAALRNIGDTADVATGSITDDDTTTVRAEWSWS